MDCSLRFQVHVLSAMEPGKTSKTDVSFLVDFPNLQTCRSKLAFRKKGRSSFDVHRMFTVYCDCLRGRSKSYNLKRNMAPCTVLIRTEKPEDLRTVFVWLRRGASDWNRVLGVRHKPHTEGSHTLRRRHCNRGEYLSSYWSFQNEVTMIHK